MHGHAVLLHPRPGHASGSAANSTQRPGLCAHGDPRHGDGALRPRGRRDDARAGEETTPALPDDDASITYTFPTTGTHVVVYGRATRPPRSRRHHLSRRADSARVSWAAGRVHCGPGPAAVSGSRTRTANSVPATEAQCMSVRRGAVRGEGPQHGAAAHVETAEGRRRRALVPPARLARLDDARGMETLGLSRYPR